MLNDNISEDNKADRVVIRNCRKRPSSFLYNGKKTKRQIIFCYQSFPYPPQNYFHWLLISLETREWEKRGDRKNEGTDYRERLIDRNFILQRVKNWIRRPISHAALYHTSFYYRHFTSDSSNMHIANMVKTEITKLKRQCRRTGVSFTEKVGQIISFITGRVNQKRTDHPLRSLA